MNARRFRFNFSFGVHRESKVISAYDTYRVRFLFFLPSKAEYQEINRFVFFVRRYCMLADHKYVLFLLVLAGTK